LAASHAVVSVERPLHPRASRREIPGAQRARPLGPCRGEQRLAERVEDPGERARERRARHDDAHRALDPLGSGAPAERCTHERARRGGSSQGRIGVARLLGRDARAFDVADRELLLCGDGEQHGAQRRGKLGRDAAQRERAGALIAALGRE